MPNCPRYEWAAEPAAAGPASAVTYGARAAAGGAAPPGAPPAPAIAPVVPLGVQPAPPPSAPPGAVTGPGGVALVPGAAVDDPALVQRAAAPGQVVRAYALMSGRLLEEGPEGAGRAVPVPAPRSAPAAVNKLTGSAMSLPAPGRP
jgi:hypothetical protein